jgi:hypothetical protein
MPVRGPALTDETNEDQPPAERGTPGLGRWGACCADGEGARDAVGYRTGTLLPAHGVRLVPCVRDRTGAAIAAIAVAAPASRCPRARLADLAQPLLAVARDVGWGL